MVTSLNTYKKTGPGGQKQLTVAQTDEVMVGQNGWQSVPIT
jgi:hypothetical protein